MPLHFLSRALPSAKGALGPLISSAVGIGVYSTWVVSPDLFSKASQQSLTWVGVQSLPQPRTFKDGVAISMNREAPPVAALEEVLRTEPWGQIEPLAESIKTEPVPLRVGDSGLVMIMASALIQASPEPKPIKAVADTVQAEVSPKRKTLAEMERPKSPAATSFSREQVLAALFGMIAKTEQQSRKPTVVNGDSLGTAIREVKADRESRSAQLFAKNPGKNLNRSDEPAHTGSGSLVIRGHIELTNGLAITNSRDKVVVSRVWNGRIQEAGSVWLRDGRFEIYVDQLVGSLNAELRSPGGALLGRGSVDLQSLSIAGRARRIDDLPLKLTPVQTGIIAKVDGFDSKAKTKLFYSGPKSTEQPLNDSGEVSDSSFADGSVTFGAIQRPGFVTTALPLIAGQVTKSRLIQTKTFQEIQDSASFEVKEVAARTLVQLRIHRSGIPVSGIEVEPLTEGSGRVVYPESEKPNQSGRDGLVHVVGAMPGTHFFVVRRDKAISDPIAVEVFDEMATDIELDISLSVRPVVQAFDVLDPAQAPLPVNVRPLGHPKARMVHVQPLEPKEVKLASLGQPSILDLDSGPDYMPMRITHSPLSNQITAPFIRRAWLDSLIGFLKFNAPKDSGTIAGFVQSGRFQIELSPDAIVQGGTRIVYLSPSGEPLDQNYGVSGGGFIALGVKSGLQTVVVHSDRSDRKLVLDVLVEPSILSTLVHWVR